MRLSAILFAVVVFCAVGVGAYRLAAGAAGWFETTTAGEIGAALDAAGQDWVEVEVDGLEVVLSGAAPDETSRFRTLEIVRQSVSDRRISDTTTLAVAEPLAPPSFALEILRNEADVSLIGLVPEAGGRDVIHSALGASGLDEHVTDMLESASDPAPAGWREALGYGLAVLAELPRAKVSIAPGEVRVIAVADSDEERAELEARLRRAAPEGVTVTAEISAPRPVIAPFAFDFTLAGGQGRLGACSADSPEAAAAIVAAARAAGLPAEAETGCRIGLGAPSPEWAQAVSRGIDALKSLGGGRFVLRDIAAELTVPEATPPAKLTEVTSTLDSALPDVFQLATVVPPRMETQADGERVYAPRFEAVLEGGNVRLTGPVQDATSRAAIESFAAALFGHDRVRNMTVLDTRLPEGWPARVLAGIEALSELGGGRVRVTRDEVAIDGWVLDEEVGEKVRTLLEAKVGRDEAAVYVVFNAEAAAAVEMAFRPRPEICADEIDAILEAGSIRFAAGSATIVPESRGVIAAIADVLRGCPGADFEIAGHTDSQGSADANRRLSDERAQAVLAALRAHDLPLVRLTARGYGAEQPVADNATPAGRARNRRIEFTLVVPGAEEEPAPQAEAEPGREPAAEETAANACAAAIGGILAEASIEFAAGSATIAPESAPLIARLAEELRGCPEAGFEIGGHTDSEGSDSGNQDLSERRAEAVLAALRAEGLALPGFVARGYGEADPVADNGTAEGRARNRRIAFTRRPGVAEGDAEGDPVRACAAQVAAILAASPIVFAAGSATIADESEPALEELKAALSGCPDAAFEVGGHTDSVGSDEGNLRLSEERARAVLGALRSDELPLLSFTARGYGEADPVADNGTAEGRAQNRGIVFEPAEEGLGAGSR